MGHKHDHSGHDHHDHTHYEGMAESRLLWALLLTASLMIAEVVGGLLSGSLALLADAGHMLVDASALGLAFLAAKLAKRPAHPGKSYGYQRFQVLAAFLNGLTLMVLGIWIILEAYDRFQNPVSIDGQMMGGVAIAGLLVNVLVFFILKEPSKTNINVEGALGHVLGDMLGSFAAITGAIVIELTGWMTIDPILSLIVCLLILKTGWSLVKKTAHILMEGTPDHIDVDELKKNLQAEIPGLCDVHHVHVWLLTTNRPLLTMHIRVNSIEDYEQTLTQTKAYLSKTYGITHSTIQVETDNCADH